MNSFHIILICFANAMFGASIIAFVTHRKKAAKTAAIRAQYEERQLELKLESENFKRKIQAHNRAQGYNEYFEKVN